MGDEWVPTPRIEERLGYGRSTSLMTLRSFEDRGEMESRPIYGDQHNHRRGLEWRWK